jgi:peptide/nickel transport system permease protein
VGAYIIRRILISIPVLFGITIIAFVILSQSGDPLGAMISPEARASMSAAQLKQLAHDMGLDAPVYERYLRWLGAILRGDLGYSTKGRLVVEEIGPRIPPTLLLMGASITVAVLVGIPFGIISAVRQYGRIDYLVTTFTMIMISTPTFLLGLILIYTLGVFLRLLPAGEMQTPGKPFSLQDLVAHMIMPVMVLGFASAAPIMRYTRAAMLEVIHSEYVTTARSKGLGSRNVLIRHGLRNALIPIITVVGLLLPDLVAGAIVTEQVFSWPGMGLLTVRAATSRDPSLMMGIVLIIATTVLVVNIVTDIAYTYADPRVRLARSG